jgi:4-amino-4-deoxy-L-arabinose transferase-like glycosyltransferase
LVTLFVHGYRLSVAPDVFSDEGVYLLVGTNVARGIGLVVNQGLFFLWHPPAYMLIEAVYIKLAGLTNADLLVAVLSVRRLNIFFSASTAALLMLFGRKLHSTKAGLITAGLFLMDPYVQRINRRNMLETLAMLCVLLGLYIFFTHRAHLRVWQCLGSGVAFGLAVLTKEAMFLELFPLIAYVMWFRRSQLPDVAWVLAIVCAVYLPYPEGLVAVGQGNSYLAYMLFGINRVLSSITGRRPPSPPPGAYVYTANKAGSLQNLQILLTQYGTSYLLIALCAIFTVVLILRFRHRVATRYLITYSIFSIGFGGVLGRISDQYFYYLIVPSTIVAGYVLASLLETLLSSRSQEETLILDQRRPLFSRTSIAYRIMWIPIFAIFFMILLYNSYLWTENYAVGSDDAYMKVMAYVRTHIPIGETIVVSDDVAYYFLPPAYDIRLDRDTGTVLDRHERYFIMSSKDAWGGYDAMTSQFYNWVVQNSRLLFEQDDRTFWKMGVYLRVETAMG